MAERRHSPAPRDSFSDLVGLVKQKKAYTPILPPTPEPQFFSAANSEITRLVSLVLR